MNIPYPSPCDKCARKTCSNAGGVGCPAWRKRYLYRQRQINAYARQTLSLRDADSPSPEPDTHFRYSHPDAVRRYLYTSPCKGCGLEPTCDTPCPIYLQWYDARMEMFRRKFYA